MEWQLMDYKQVQKLTTAYTSMTGEYRIEISKNNGTKQFEYNTRKKLLYSQQQHPKHPSQWRWDHRKVQRQRLKKTDS